MRFIHIADLHLGKRVNEMSMLDDQFFILKKIMQIIIEEQADAVLVAGDVYDRSVPSEEAIKLWDTFLYGLAERNIPVYAISGNHDSAVRFANHAKLMQESGVHLANAYDGTVVRHVLSDSHGEIHIYMLPFIKPVHVREALQKDDIVTYTDACHVAIENMQVDENVRNILVAHQFVTGAVQSDSEEIVVGGIDQVDAAVFAAFDYVALGHIHGPQHVGREEVRYSGTPLKYSFSEKDHKKSVTVVNVLEKGKIQISTRELIPLHDLREIRGSFEVLVEKENYEKEDTEDYIHAILTDENDVIDAVAKLRIIYPNIMKVTYDNKRTREQRVFKDEVDVQKSEFELFSEFYELQNNQPMSEEQASYVSSLIRSILEG